MPQQLQFPLGTPIALLKLPKHINFSAVPVAERDELILKILNIADKYIPLRTNNKPVEWGTAKFPDDMPKNLPQLLARYDFDSVTDAEVSAAEMYVHGLLKQQGLFRN